MNPGDFGHCLRNIFIVSIYLVLHSLYMTVIPGQRLCTFFSDNGSSSCPPDWFPSPDLADDCFMIIELGNENWDRAQLTCTYSKANLASILTAGEYQAVQGNLFITQGFKLMKCKGIPKLQNLLFACHTCFSFLRKNNDRHLHKIQRKQ